MIVNDRYVKIALANTIMDKVNVKTRALRTALIATDSDVIKGELAKDAGATPVHRRCAGQAAGDHPLARRAWPR